MTAVRNLHLASHSIAVMNEPLELGMSNVAWTDFLYARKYRLGENEKL